MLFLTLALVTAVTAPPTCTDVKQQCRACPTAGSVKGCSTVGIACQPTRRICEPVMQAKAVVRPDRNADKTSR